MAWPKGKPHTPEMIAKRTASFVANGKKRKRQNDDGTWRCPACDRNLPAGGFHSSKRSPNGLSSQCRECHSVGSMRTRDPGKRRERNRRSEANRRSRIAGANGRVTRDDYAQLERILGRACLKCGAAQRLTWDHIIPLSKGGDHHPLNLQPLCRACNEKKQARAADYRTDEHREAVAKVWCIAFERVKQDA